MGEAQFQPQAPFWLRKEAPNDGSNQGRSGTGGHLQAEGEPRRQPFGRETEGTGHGLGRAREASAGPAGSPGATKEVDVALSWKSGSAASSG